ncbi:MAG: DUF2116 family Zn-ribbon domain-containing protein [archaeon]
MQEQIECPLCNEKIYSGLGKGCKMCGMVINPKEKFCSSICRKEYAKINK